MLESLFNKVACLEACNFIKKRLQRRCFLMNIAKFLRTAFFIEHLWRMLLNSKKLQQGTVMQIEKALINDCLRVSKVS